jgi:hypothetical protein
MSFGVELNSFAFTYGSLSVVQAGAISPGSTVTVTKSNHPDITDWRVVFTPTGVRNIGEDEVRPSFSNNAATVTMTSPADASPHNYLVLGR